MRITGANILRTEKSKSEYIHIIINKEIKYLLKLKLQKKCNIYALLI